MSPLGTKTLHKGGNLQHLLTILLVGCDHLGFSSNNFHTSKLIRGHRETFANRF
jgi:hypothetical protein